MTTKYLAKLVVDGTEHIVFPRTKRTMWFTSIKLAERALDRKSRAFHRDTLGRVYDPEGKCVWRVAL